MVIRIGYKNGFGEKVYSCISDIRFDGRMVVLYTHPHAIDGTAMMRCAINLDDIVEVEVLDYDETH